MTRKIPLTQGFEAVVDEADYAAVSQYVWQAVQKNKTVYARRCVSVNGKQAGKQYLHHFLMGKNPGFEVDHISGDALDNRRENLRWATSSQQKWNQSLSVRNTSGVKGVSWSKERNKWQAYITVGRKMKMLGKFSRFEDAVNARKDAEKKMHGEFAREIAPTPAPSKIISYDGRLNKAEWEVREIPISEGRKLVEELHYAKGASNTAVAVHGLFKKGMDQCFGVAWWIPPTMTCAQKTFPEFPNGVLSLSRLAVSPEVPKNGCTFLLAKSVRMINRHRWPCLVTYADDWRGHQGTIYKASNWQYCGKTRPEPTYTVNGVMTARKAGPRTRTHAEMLALGATFEGKHAKHKFVLIQPQKLKAA